MQMPMKTKQLMKRRIEPFMKIFHNKKRRKKDPRKKQSDGSKETRKCARFT